MNRIGRLRFYAYTALLVLIAIAIPTPDLRPLVAISAEVIVALEIAYWLARAVQHRRSAVVTVLSVAMVAVVALLVTTIHHEVRRYQQMIEEITG